MLQVSGLGKRFGGRQVIEEASFVVNDGERLGVVGANGSGKTTLLRMVAGELAPDAGAVTMTPAARIGYARQGFAGCANERAEVVFPSLFTLVGASRRIEELAGELAHPRDEASYDAAAAAYERAVAAAEQDDGAVLAAWRASGLRDVAPGERAGALSGGEQTKLALLDALAIRPSLLLLDEPTNNLDLPALAWLDDVLAAFRGPVVLVSHDRALLDDHATAILEVDARSARATTCPGNYSAYAAEKARRHEEQWAAYRQQQQRERRVEREVRAIKDAAMRRHSLTQNDFYRRKAKILARRAVVLERRLRREVAGERRVEKPLGREYRVKAEFASAGRSGDRMLDAGPLDVVAGGRTLVHDATFSLAWGERVVLVGPNGSGKTSLLRAVVAGNAGAVHTSPSTRVGYLEQAEADAGDTTLTGTPLSVMRAAAPLSETEARRFLHRFLFSGDDVHTPVQRLSYGERRRLALARLVAAGANLLLLDEPTNHLDIPSREALEAALDAYDGAMLVVTHDRRFIERFAQRLFEIEDGQLREI